MSEGHPKKPLDETRIFEDDSTGASGGVWEGHVLQQCSWLQPGLLLAEAREVTRRHLKKPQDEARNFEEDSRRAQGVLWEGHVLK